MPTQDLVLIDTCMWVPFFNKPPSREKQAVAQLIDDDRAGIVGPILTEVLLGFRRDEQADWVASVVRGVKYLEISWEQWRAAAHLGRRLVAAGHVLPLSDLAIASVALEHEHSVYSIDPHFDVIVGLKRFSP